MAEMFSQDKLKPSVYYDTAINLYKIYFEGTYDSIGLYLTSEGVTHLMEQIQKSQKEIRLQEAI